MSPPLHSGRTRSGAPLSGPRQEVKEVLFFRAAEPLFERFGYRKTTVEEICRAAGASKRTFYQAFTGKADLASRWILHISQAIVSRWKAAVAPRMTAREKLDLFLDEYVRLGREHRVFGQMMYDADLLRAFGDLTTDRRFQLLLDVLKGILVEGIRSGEFRRLDARSVTWIIYSLLDTMYYLVPTMGALPSPFENPKLSRELRAFVTHALLQPERSDHT